MAQVLRTPDPRLRPLLQRAFVGFSRAEPEASTWLAAPRPTVTIMIDVDGSLRADGEPMPHAWVGGLGGAPTDVTISPRYAGLDLKLTPLGAYRLLAMPLSELAGGEVALDDVFAKDVGDELYGRVGTAVSWPERFEVVEAFLLDRASEGPEPAPFVEWAWRRIGETGGRVAVGELAAEIGCSRRHLQAKFTEQVGLSPKLAIRMTRFERVCLALEATPGRWADLAAEAGYADQAHLNRDFRDLAGTTPSEYLLRVAL